MRYLILLIPVISFAEIKTTDNLLSNGNFETGNTQGWTTTGDVAVFNDCCSTNNSQYDVEIGDSGYLEQDFKLYSNTITQPMLDNGVELRSSVLSQNGECSLPGCWAGSGRGGADSFSVRLQIKDNQNNVLSTVEQIRYDITDINGETFEDTLIYNSTGAWTGNIRLGGEDANAPSSWGGVNFDDVSVRMVYDDTVLSETQTQELSNAVEILEEAVESFEEFIPEEVESLIIEEIPIAEIETVLPEIFEIVELSEEEELVEETFIVAPEIISEAPVEAEVVEEMPTESVEIVEEVFAEVTEAPEESASEVEEVVNEEEIISENESGSTNETAESETETTTETAQSSTNQPNSDANEPTDTPDSPSESTTVAVSVSDIQKKVDDKIKTTEGRLKAVSLIVAKIMSKSNNKIDSYSQINAEIFDQPVIIDRNIDEYLTRDYVDTREIYTNITYGDRLDWISR